MEIKIIFIATDLLFCRNFYHGKCDYIWHEDLFKQSLCKSM